MFACADVVGDGDLAAVRRVRKIRRGIDLLPLPVEHTQRLRDGNHLLHQRVVVVREEEEVQVARIPNPEDIEALPVHADQHGGHVVDGHFLQAGALRRGQPQHQRRSLNNERLDAQRVARVGGLPVGGQLHRHHHLVLVGQERGHRRHVRSIRRLVAPFVRNLEEGVFAQRDGVQVNVGQQVLFAL